MSIRYLTRGLPVNLTGGAGTGRLTPPTGQFWIPRTVRVGATLPTNLQYPTNQPPLVCQLYHGGVGDVGSDAFVDGTANGIGDVTSVLNGTLIQPGEYLTARWDPIDLFHSTINASGYLQIVGLTADTITEATSALATAVPGPGFTAPLSYPMHMPVSANDSALFQFMNPGPGGSVILLSGSTGAYLYVYSLFLKFYPAVAAVNGYFSSDAAPFTFPIAYVDPYADTGPYTFYYHGVRMIPNGLVYFQSGTGAANQMTFSVVTQHRFMLF